MTNSITKILLALLTLTLMTGAASAQQRTLYDSSGQARSKIFLQSPIAEAVAYSRPLPATSGSSFASSRDRREFKAAQA